MPQLSFQGLVFALAAFVVAVIVNPVMIRIASARGWFDAPGARKVHNLPVPRLGGVSIYLGTWTAWGIFAFLYPNVIPYESTQVMWSLFIASTLIFGLGIYDDLFGANAWKKLAVQLVASAIVVSYGVHIRFLYNPMVGTDMLIDASTFWILSVAWIVVMTNAINLIDGLDGLAGGVCLITSLTIFFISKGLGHPHIPYFALVMAGACMGFLVFNFSPARIFLGDSGSLFLGFVLACLSIMGTAKRSTAIIMFGPPLILALPMVDTLLAIFRRFLRREPGDLGARRLFWHPVNAFKRVREIFQADQEHIHHGLLKLGLSHRRAVMVLYGVTLVLGVTAYQVALYDHVISTAVIFAVLSLVFFWFLRKVKRTR